MVDFVLGFDDKGTSISTQAFFYLFQTDMSLLKALIQGLLRGFHFQQYGDASVFFQRDTGAKEHLSIFGEVIHAKIAFA